MNLHHGDCLDVLRAMPSASADALVSDPPAGIGFMGKAWDGDKGGRDAWVAWMTEVMAECLRLLKPGAHALVWALPRTSHWTATALEDAGFEVRDVVTHLFGTGFPKSLDVSKAIDKAAGAEREIIGPRKRVDGKAPGHSALGTSGIYSASADLAQLVQTSPATDAAKQWQGWGTALKPASEHWILCRKPLAEKTVAANVLKHGTGALNIDASRISCEGGSPSAQRRTAGKGDWKNSWDRSLPGVYEAVRTGEQFGRFPANLILSHNDDCDASCTEGCAVQELDSQSGVSKSPSGNVKGQSRQSNQFGGGGKSNGHHLSNSGHGDSGGASRFFYCAKSSKSDRNRKVKP